MNFWASKQIKKTRKPHTCLYCGLKMPIGSSCSSECGVYEGEFQHYHLCDRCRCFINQNWNYDDDSLGEFWDDLIKNGYLDCPNCKHSNARERDFNEDKQSVIIQCDDCDTEYVVDISLEAFKAKGGK